MTLVKSTSALLLALATALLLLAISAPHAAALDALVCRGSGRQTYRPGITNRLQIIGVTDGLRLGSADNPLVPCIALGSTVTGGSVDLAYSKEISCTNPFSPASTTSLVISWDNGQRSTYTNSSTLTQANGQTIVTSTGRITAGLYNGHAVVATITYFNLSAGELAACATPTGLTMTNSLIVFTIV
jgi:hypothetical protein